MRSCFIWASCAEARWDCWQGQVAPPGSSFVKSTGIRRGEQTGRSLWGMTAAHSGPLTGDQWLKHQWWFVIFGGVESSLGTAGGPHPALFLVTFRRHDAPEALLTGTISQRLLIGGFFLLLQAKSWRAADWQGVTVPGPTSLILPFLWLCVLACIPPDTDALF